MAQVRVVGPGSTVQGDILRGEGVFLQGAGWYDVNESRARSIDANTNIRIQRWNQMLYEAYRQDVQAADKKMKAYDKAKRAKLDRLADEREVQLRTNPKPIDVQKGDALNALLIDLSDPAIKGDSWYTAKVGLPPDLSIRKLVFRFAAHPADKGSGTLGNALISIGRLDKTGEESWPIFLRDQKLNTERLAYENAYKNVRDKCVGQNLRIDDAISLIRTVDALRNKAAAALPTELGTRKSGVQFVEDMSKAAEIFNATTIDFAQEIIKDTQEHEAHSVFELRGFMRKYRLMFAPAGKQPGDGEIYERLYGLLFDQKKALGLKDPIVLKEARPPAVKPAPTATGRWLHQGNVENVLLPNGSIQRKGIATGQWSIAGRRLTLRWPNARAPGGAWVDEVELSEDGNSYQGKNQKGTAIRGIRLAD